MRSFCPKHFFWQEHQITIRRLSNSESFCCDRNSKSLPLAADIGFNLTQRVATAFSFYSETDEVMKYQRKHSA